MIEVQLNSKELYDELKQYAIYSSDLTRVCSFNDSLYKTLIEHGVELKKEILVKNKKPVLDIQGKNVMKLKNAPAEMLHFVGVRTEMDPTIPIRYTHEISCLIEHGLVALSNKFLRIYSPMDYSNKISDLICAPIRYQKTGRLTDFLDENLTIKSLRISECSKKNIAYRMLSVNIAGPLEQKDKWDEIICNCPELKKRVVLRFYSRSLILKSIAFKGNNINVATSKIKEEKGKYVIYDPIILPKGLQWINDTMYSPPNRQIPVTLWRNAYYEFELRNWLKKNENKIIREVNNT